MRWFRVQSKNMPYHGIEFEVDDDATEEQIEKASWEAVAETVDYGLVEINGPDGESIDD